VSASTTPVVLLLSATSADPLPAIHAMAIEHGGGGGGSGGVGDGPVVFSLGHGQAPAAVVALEAAMKKGSWVVLQNVHLVPPLLPALAEICGKQALAHAHPEFRLWLTTTTPSSPSSSSSSSTMSSSSSSSSLPSSFLQHAEVISVGSSRGVRAHMLHAYTTPPLANVAFLDGCRHGATFKALALALSFLHAVLRSRQWSGSNGGGGGGGGDGGSACFSHDDLSVVLSGVHQYLNEQVDAGTDAAAFAAATAEAVYGGCLTTAADRAALRELVRRCVNANTTTGAPLSLCGSGSTTTTIGGGGGGGGVLADALTDALPAASVASAGMAATLQFASFSVPAAGDAGDYISRIAMLPAHDVHDAVAAPPVTLIRSGEAAAVTFCAALARVRGGETSTSTSAAAVVAVSSSKAPWHRTAGARVGSSRINSARIGSASRAKSTTAATKSPVTVDALRFMLDTVGLPFNAALIQVGVIPLACRLCQSLLALHLLFTPSSFPY
jgi:hypothetical protein